MTSFMAASNASVASPPPQARSRTWTAGIGHGTTHLRNALRMQEKRSGACGFVYSAPCAL